MGVHWHVICHSSLVAFNILSFVSLITMSQCVLPWVHSVWDTLCFLDLVDYFLSQLGKFTAIISANIFSGRFSLLLGPL